MTITSDHFKLRFDRADIPEVAARYKYQYEADEQEIASTVVPAVRKHGFFTKDQLVTLARWKSPRTQPRVLKNSEQYVEETTRLALSTASERLRVEVLTLLNGVRWPTASVILHFAHDDRYPILDYRALWSFSSEVPSQYTFDFWRAYTEACRRLADDGGVDMRTLDRALWQYSKENQP